MTDPLAPGPPHPLAPALRRPGPVRLEASRPLCTWSLRVNPSSGNLRPTEGYLVCGPIAGLTDIPMVADYAPRGHAVDFTLGGALQDPRIMTLPACPGPLTIGHTGH
jgi:hypothetical protein